VIVIVYVMNKRDNSTIVKLPDNSGGGTYDGWDEGQSVTAGQGIVFGGTQTDAPTDIVIETLVMGHEPLGDPQKVKSQIHDAVQNSADEVAAAEGVPPGSIPTWAIDLATQGLFTVVDSIFGLTDQVRGKPQSKTYYYANWDTLPPVDAYRFGPLTYNWETEIMTDGDASYKAYFNLAKHTITS